MWMQRPETSWGRAVPLSSFTAQDPEMKNECEEVLWGSGMSSESMS